MDRCNTCFYCGSPKVVKNGKTYYFVQRYKCGDCHRQFVAKRNYFKLSNEQKELMGSLPLERISLEGICRVLRIPAYHLYSYMDKLYREIPDDLYVSALVASSEDIGLQRFECENDEAWSFVGSKGNKQWMAMHRASRMVVGLFVGERGAKGAKGLWDSIPQGKRIKKR